MPRFEVSWPYTGMNSVFTSLDATDGVFGLTKKSEWQAVPRAGVEERLVTFSFGRSGPLQGNPKVKFAMVGSLHKYFFDVQSTGVSACHVGVADHMFLAVSGDRATSYVMEFDLPSTAHDDFARSLERVGGERAKHPWYDEDKKAFTEDVSLLGDTMRIAFHVVGK
jgi:hypothetical protein